MAINKVGRIRSHYGVKKPAIKILQNLRKVGRSGLRYGLCSLRKLGAVRLPRSRELRHLYRRNLRSRSRFLANVEREVQEVFAEPAMSRPVTDSRVTDMKYFYPTTNFNRLPHGVFTQVCQLAEGINGDIFKYRWCKGQGGEDVAVKKIRQAALKRTKDEETNERILHLWPRAGQLSAEDAVTEIGVMTYLSAQKDLPRYILGFHAAFAEVDFTWVVLEFADGGELFDVAVAGRASEEQTRLYMWQLLQAVSYLHKHSIGHRDVSLENVLLKGNEVRLMDFGMAVQSHSMSGTPLRYFRPAGKDFYRAPECYVPRSEAVCVEVPDFALPGEVVMATTSDGFLCEVRLPADAAPKHRCNSDVWGYAVHPADIFSTGICLFMLGFQCAAWSIARLYNPSFEYVYSHGDQGIVGLVHKYKKEPMSSEAMRLLVGMLCTDPTKRLSVAECLSCEWFAKDSQFSGARVPLHHD